MITTKGGKVIPAEYFDDSNLGKDVYDIPVILANPDREERGIIRDLKTIYRGVMFVTGGAGQGKDLFVVVLAYLMRRFFGRRIVFDFKPRSLFGEYYYFNPQTMMKEIDKMAKMAGVSVEKKDVSPEEKKEMTDKMFTEAAIDWIGENEVLFEGALVYFSELRRYCYNRSAQNKVNKFIGALNTQWRHLDMLIIGSHIQEHEIDQYTFLENVNFWAKCTWNPYLLDTTSVKVERHAYTGESGVYKALLEDIIFDVDGGKPRSYLTNADTIFVITPKGMAEASKVSILRYLLHNGPAQASVIAEQLGLSVEVALRELYVLSTGGYIIGNRFFDLYSTKSKVNLRPSLREEV